MQNFQTVSCVAKVVQSTIGRSAWIFKSKEIILGGLFLVLAIFISPLLEKFEFQDHLVSIDPTKTSLYKEYVESSFEQLDIKKIIEHSRSYAYSDTQLGFFLKDLNFFENHSKKDAEKKILNSLPKALANRAKIYLRAILKVSERHQVDPIWVLSVMWTESNFDYSAKSWAGARGLMQIMPDTRKFVYGVYKSEGQNLIVEEGKFNIYEYFQHGINQKNEDIYINKLANIELGVIYLKKLLNSFKSHQYATVAYNMGPGWTRGRLRKNLPVGQKNVYLDKVKRAYQIIVQKI